MGVLGIVKRATLAGEILAWEGIEGKDTFNHEMWSWSECEIVEVKMLGIITENTVSLCSAWI